MTKKLFILGVLGLVSGLTTAFAADDVRPDHERDRERDTRFTCTFEGPTVVPVPAGKGGIVPLPVPLVCTAFGEFERRFDDDRKFRDDGDDHLTVICGNAVLYSDGVIATFPTSNAAELRSIVPGVAIVTIRTLTQGSFRGPLGSVLRIDIPGTPQALLTGVCHLNRRHFDDPIEANLE